MNARGFTLLEVLITLIILAIGMLGLANLQSKIHTLEIESYQRTLRDYRALVRRLGLHDDLDSP